MGNSHQHCSSVQHPHSQLNGSDAVFVKHLPIASPQQRFVAGRAMPPSHCLQNVYKGLIFLAEHLSEVHHVPLRDEPAPALRLERENLKRAVESSVDGWQLEEVARYDHLVPVRRGFVPGTKGAAHLNPTESSAIATNMTGDVVELI